MKRTVLLLGSLLLALLPCSCQLPSGARFSGAAAANALTLDAALARARATYTSNAAADRAVCAAATERAALLWFARTDGSRTPIKVEGAGGTFTLSASWPEHVVFDQLISAPPAGSGDDGAGRREGVGAALVARWRATPERQAKHPFLSEGGYLVCLTATLDFRGQSAALRLHDPRFEESVTIGGQRVPLAADLSAMGRVMQAEMKRDKGLGISALSALRHSGESIDKIGLFTLEPPSRDRIPLVMVHGLMSRPLTWQVALNALSADPVVARRYQFYFFRYPTGVPVVYSAAKCREELATLKRELVRIGNTAHRNRIILIGHSMGGLVSKTQVQSSGDRLWITALGATPDKLNLPAAEIQALRPLVEFEPNPDVSRVVFVCTPHRGSSLAEGFIGKIGRRLIKLPLTALGGAFALLPTVAPASPVVQRMIDSGVPSSVENLSPSSLFVRESMSLPLKRGLHIHSIVGNRKGLPLDDPKCSDGAVPYSSAHLDNVESELVVRSGHSAHETPEAIAEIRRILLLHCGVRDGAAR